MEANKALLDDVVRYINDGAFNFDDDNARRMFVRLFVETNGDIFLLLKLFGLNISTFKLAVKENELLRSDLNDAYTLIFQKIANKMFDSALNAGKVELLLKIAERLERYSLLTFIEQSTNTANGMVFKWIDATDGTE